MISTRIHDVPYVKLLPNVRSSTAWLKRSRLPKRDARLSSILFHYRKRLLKVVLANIE